VVASSSENVLCGLDYGIIRSLQDDARKSLAEVAEELGVSTKTVRRRLDRMVRNSLVELSVEWYPDKSNDIIMIVELRFKPGVDSKVAFGFSRKYFPRVLFLWTYANIPDLAMLALWTNSMSEVQSMRELLEKEPDVASVNMNILYVGYIFKTWRDQIPVE
jgi:DNA-binding Lrp family transcriptional regulator